MIKKKLSNKATLSFFVVIISHLLPLTNYLVNGQYGLVQPIASKFVERCICTILTTNMLALKMLIYDK